MCPFATSSAIFDELRMSYSDEDVGKVMGGIKSKAAGKADMGAVGARVKARLA